MTRKVLLKVRQAPTVYGNLPCATDALYSEQIKLKSYNNKHHFRCCTVAQKLTKKCNVAGHSKRHYGLQPHQSVTCLTRMRRTGLSSPASFGRGIIVVLCTSTFVCGPSGNSKEKFRIRTEKMAYKAKLSPIVGNYQALS